MKVVGGIYWENCLFPKRHQLMGSGLRAAAAVSTLTKNVTMHGYVDEQTDATLQQIAATFQIQLETTIVDQTVLFDYIHGLAVPNIIPDRSLVNQAQPLHCDGDLVVSFGMLEGNAVVQAECAVYDPQDNLSPQPFNANGSTAKSLAIVINKRQAILMSGSKNQDDWLSYFFEKELCTVLVVKMGARGASVYTSEGLVGVVPCYKTEFVWPIGSGDVFTALFAFYWGEQKLSPLEAADNASMGTAFYCQTETLPIPQYNELKEIIKFHPIKAASQSDKYPTDKKYDVYLAGPFFTLSSLWLVNEARRCLLELGLRVFSPFHDVGVGPAEEVAPKDLEALDQSKLVLALVDNLDTGTIFEVGYARAKDIPVFVFVQNESEEDLKMLSGSGCNLSNDLVTTLYQIMWSLLE